MNGYKEQRPVEKKIEQERREALQKERAATKRQRRTGHRIYAFLLAVVMVITSLGITSLTESGGGTAGLGWCNSQC